MKLVCVLLVFCIGSSRGFLLGYDPEACAPAPGPSAPRLIDASIPTLFDSPGYNASDPDNSVYPPNTVCEWSIFSTAPEPMRLNFVRFQIEDSPSCTKDMVDIFYGLNDTADPVGRFCGAQSPVIDARANQELFVRFTTDDTVEDVGFLARAGFLVDTERPCNDGEIITEPSGLIFSSNYPENYNDNEICSYEFQAPPGQRVEIEFGAFELAQNCNDDILEIYNGDPRVTPMAYRVAQFSGQEQLPAKMMSPANTAFVRFTSDNTGTAPGFWAQYQFV